VPSSPNVEKEPGGVTSWKEEGPFLDECREAARGEKIAGKKLNKTALPIETLVKVNKRGRMN